MVKWPHPYRKLVRCRTGSVFDVAAYLGRDSSTFERGIGRELDAVTAAALLVPPGFGHGMLALTAGRHLEIRVGSGAAWRQMDIGLESSFMPLWTRLDVHGLRNNLCRTSGNALQSGYNFASNRTLILAEIGPRSGLCLRN